MTFNELLEQNKQQSLSAKEKLKSLSREVEDRDNPDNMIVSDGEGSERQEKSAHEEPVGRHTRQA